MNIYTPHLYLSQLADFVDMMKPKVG